jgi:anthraniloyl-CoA monooxygenase
VHWDDIAVHYRGEMLTSTGHGFSGMSRHTLLRVLQEHARAAGVELVFEREVEDLAAFAGADLVVASDGANSAVRRLLEGRVRTTVDVRPNRFVWLGTTKPFPAFTFYFRRNGHGLWRVHAYRYAPGASTFIVECRDEAWRAAGLEDATEAETVAYLEALFAEELEGHRLVANKSIWRQFPTIRVAPWSAEHVVLIGDAAHTAHFSVGSGTRLAMEDAVALRDALEGALAAGDVETPAAIRRGLEAYETGRRPQVESLQRAAQASLQWFEDTERYMSLAPLQFAFTLLTRSLRITHGDLRVRDPEFVARLDAFVAAEAARQVAETEDSPLVQPDRRQGNSPLVPPPMFTPFRLRDLVIPNRVVVSPMCQYVALDGRVGDWHLVHLGSRAMGGAGLVMAEMTDVSPEARISPGCAGLYCGEHVGAWRRVVDFIHRETPAKVGIQLGHAGRKGATRLQWEGDNEPLPAGAQWPDSVGFADSVLSRSEPRATRDDPRGHGRSGARLRPGHALRDRGRVRPARGPHGARLPAGVVHLAADQHARRRVRRHAAAAHAVSLSKCSTRAVPCGRRSGP